MENYLSEYLPILIFIIIGFAIAIGMTTLSFVVGERKPDNEKLSAYECGFEAFDDARGRFDVRFYLVAILFIIFDLEVAFLFPWAISLGAIGLFGFMMQRGRIVILGDVGINLGDSMYDGTIYVGGKIGSFGSDAVESPMTKDDMDWLKRKLKVAEIGENFDVSKMTKVVAGKTLWNYDALEPTEKKGAI